MERTVLVGKARAWSLPCMQSGSGQHSARGGLRARGGRRRFLGLGEPDPQGPGVRLQAHLRSTALLGFLRAGSWASPAARRGCLTTSAPAHVLMRACLGAMLSDCLCCTLSRGGEAPTQRLKVLPAPLGGQKPVGAQSTVSQACGQKGKGSKLS